MLTVHAGGTGRRCVGWPLFQPGRTATLRGRLGRRLLPGMSMVTDEGMAMMEQPTEVVDLSLNAAGVLARGEALLGTGGDRAAFDLFARDAALDAWMTKPGMTVADARSIVSEMRAEWERRQATGRAAGSVAIEEDIVDAQIQVVLLDPLDLEVHVRERTRVMESAGIGHRDPSSLRRWIGNALVRAGERLRAGNEAAISGETHAESLESLI